MNALNPTEKAASAGRGQRMLDWVERVGNRLPDPVTLFLLSILGLIALSALLASQGVAVRHPGTGQMMSAVSLADATQMRRLFIELPQIFVNFPPLGLVLIIVMGIGVAERTGLIAVALGRFVRAMPTRLLSFTIVFAGVVSSIATDAGYVVLPPLAALLYASVGRHPVAGIAAAFAGVAGGFGANLVIIPLDPILAGLTQAAARLIDPAYTVYATANYFIMTAMVPVYAVVGAVLTDRVVEPRLNRGAALRPGLTLTDVSEPDAEEQRLQRRGLRATGIALLIMVILTALMVVPADAPLRDPGSANPLEPFLRALVTILFIIFLVCGIVYGVATKRIRSDRDVVEMMSKSLGEMGGYIVLSLACAVFIALFAWSNIGLILAVEGAGFLREIGFVGLPLLLGIILVSSLINLLIGSASAKWAIMAPVLVPMLMQLGISPEATQAAYRIGDAFSNTVTPLLPYFPLVLVMCQRYVAGFGLGSLIATMLPYCIWFGIASSAVFAGWILLDLPLGPGVSVFYSVPAAP
jgi:aminobenzoyl-glutamate transport protein